MPSKSVINRVGRIAWYTPRKRNAKKRRFGGFNTFENGKLVWVATNQPEANPILTGRDEGPSVQEEPTLPTLLQRLKSKKVSYAEKKKKMSSEWTSIRQQLVEQIVISASPSKYYCHLCKEYFERICRCLDCGPHAYFCKDCCGLHHEIVFLHMPEMWNPQLHCFEDLDLNSTWKRPDGHKCEDTMIAKITIFDERGRQHKQKIHMCKHSSTAAILVQYGLWPASPFKPYVAFSVQFMLTLKAMVLDAHVSLQAFCRALQQCRPGLQRPLKEEWVGDLYRIINWECVINFFWVDHNVDHLQFAAIDFPDGSKCDACPKEDDTDQRLIAMDGNMKLVHRAKAGHSVREPLHAGRFFLPQKAVDDFVDSQHIISNPSQNCSNFQVESVIRTKNKTSKLDNTGAYAAVCNHDHPDSITNLRHGEKMGYPIYMMNSIPNIGILMYDIGCQLEIVLKKRKIPYTAKIGVPIFHVYGHKMSCQLRYSPRRIEGAGLFDGEGTERLWSYLGKFSKITKEMTPENRQDVLVQALLNYGQKISFNMAQSLGRRLCKAYMLRDSTEDSLMGELSLYPGVSKGDIESMAAQEKVRAEKPKKGSPRQFWTEQYALDLSKYYLHRNAVRNEVVDVPDEETSRLEAIVIKVEKYQKIARWAEEDPNFHAHLMLACQHERFKRLEQLHDAVIQYNHMGNLKLKYAEGQNLVKRIMPQLHETSKKVNRAVAAYNTVPCKGPADPPHRIKRDEVMLDKASIWQFLCPAISGPANIPTLKKRKLIDLFQLNQRAKEEIVISSKDFGRHLRSLRQQEKKLNDEIIRLKADPEKTRYEAGTLALLVRNWFRVCIWIKAVESISSRITQVGPVDVEAFHELVEEMNKDSECPSEVTEIIDSLEEVNDIDRLDDDDDDLEE